MGQDCRLEDFSGYLFLPGAAKKPVVFGTDRELPLSNQWSSWV
jgi:hypothetical protein